MTAPLHMTSPDAAGTGADNGDVLASIRRLISNGDTATPGATPLTTPQQDMVATAPLRLRPDALITASDTGAPDPAAPPPEAVGPDHDARPPVTAEPQAGNAAPLHHASNPLSHEEATDMHVQHQATVSPFQPEAAAQPVVTSPPQLQVAAPVEAESNTPTAIAPDNPLRTLLRGAVRDELDREMRHRLETDLRQLIRAELSAALTEALTRPSAA